MEFQFDDDGFLTERGGELEDALRAAHGTLFDRIAQINRDCHGLLHSADIRNRDGQAVLTATLFVRALEHYQATFLLLRRGLIAPARAALRALVETVFRIRAIAADTAALKTFIAEDLVHRKKLINKARNNAYPNLEAARAAITADLVKEAEEEIKAAGAKALTTEEWSRTAGMHDWYATNYTLLSQAVHTQVRDLEAYLKFDQSGEIKELEYAPSLEEIPELALTAAHLMLIAASAFDKVFAIGFGQKADSHTKFVAEAFQALNEAEAARAEGARNTASASDVKPSGNAQK
jgi:2-oxo-4-hydroxy-4-carboxy--5-ureidoimidazoline (OHCU) decarboxylase